MTWRGTCLTDMHSLHSPSYIGTAKNVDVDIQAGYTCQPPTHAVRKLWGLQGMKPMGTPGGTNNGTARKKAEKAAVSTALKALDGGACIALEFSHLPLMMSPCTPAAL